MDAAKLSTLCMVPLSLADFRKRNPRLRERAGRRGFTLLEVLLSLAIIALLASVLIGGASGLMNDKPVAADEIFVKCVQEARKAALKSEYEVQLGFDEKEKKFVITGKNILKEFPVPSTPTNELIVSLLPAQRGGSTFLLGGMLVEMDKLPFVSFYPDGTCAPFRAQFYRNGNSYNVNIDPWTCAPVLTPPDPNAPTSF